MGFDGEEMIVEIVILFSLCDRNGVWIYNKDGEV
jgi:hypothetical protein